MALNGYNDFRIYIFLMITRYIFLILNTDYPASRVSWCSCLLHFANLRGGGGI